MIEELKKLLLVLILEKLGAFTLETVRINLTFKRKRNKK